MLALQFTKSKITSTEDRLKGYSKPPLMGASSICPVRRALTPWTSRVGLALSLLELKIQKGRKKERIKERNSAWGKDAQEGNTISELRERKRGRKKGVIYWKDDKKKEEKERFVLVWKKTTLTILQLIHSRSSSSRSSPNCWVFCTVSQFLQWKLARHCLPISMYNGDICQVWGAATYELGNTSPCTTIEVKEHWAWLVLE